MAKSKSEEQSVKPTIEEIMAEINKKAGETVVARVSEFPELSLDRLKTGIKKLDEAAGDGFPLGRIVELYGPPSSGKSLVSLLLVADAQRRGLEAVYVDCENSFDGEFAKKFGVNPEKLILIQDAIGEEFFDMLRRLLVAEPGIIVVDSVGAMTTKPETEESMEQAFMAPKARLMSKGLAILNALNSRTLIVFINQLRGTMDLYGPKSTTTGGKALGYYASIRMEISRPGESELLRVGGLKSGDVIGQIMKFRVTKNKTAAPFKEGSVKFMYNDFTFK